MQKLTIWPYFCIKIGDYFFPIFYGNLYLAKCSFDKLYLTSVYLHIQSTNGDYFNLRNWRLKGLLQGRFTESLALWQGDKVWIFLIYISAKPNIGHPYNMVATWILRIEKQRNWVKKSGLWFNLIVFSLRLWFFVRRKCTIKQYQTLSNKAKSRIIEREISPSISGTHLSS